MNEFFLAATLIFAYMNVGFLLSLLFKRNDLADILWGFGFVLVSGTLLVMRTTFTDRAVLTFLGIFIWATRLSLYVAFRNLGHSEDWRYKAWREQWKGSFLWRSYLQVWILQGVIMFLISLALIWQMRNYDQVLTPWDFVAFLLWVIGMFFEATADEQLRRFKKNPKNKGKIMATGVWKYSRHPNYFGEACLWWGFTLAALHLPQGYVALISGGLITFMLLKVSGVTMLEKGMENRPGFAEYRRTTSAFVPWFKLKARKD